MIFRPLKNTTAATIILPLFLMTFIYKEETLTVAGKCGQPKPLDDFQTCFEMLMPVDGSPARSFGHDLKPATGAHS